jgi:hypothetical protein
MAGSGEASVSTNKLTNSSALEEPDVLEDLLSVTSDPSPEPVLPLHVTTFLGEQLQTFYAHLMAEPVPDRFVQLLAQLDGKENRHDGE